MKILLAPLTKIANLIEDQKEMVKEVHAFLTVDLKKVTVDNSKELKKQTILLTDIRDLLKEQIKQKQSEQSGKAPKIKLPGIIGGIGVGLAMMFAFANPLLSVVTK